MLTQAVLRITAKRGLKEDQLFSYIGEFVDERFINGLAFSHMRKRLHQDLIKYPVDQIIFILKMTVKCLSGRSACPDDLRHCDLLQRHLSHALFQRLGQQHLHLFFLCHHTASSSP